MKKLIITLILIFPLFTLASFNTDLKFGIRSQKVIELQQFLKEQGHFNYEITGNFFGITKKAVQDFQLANGIINTGYWGILSRTKANEILESQITKETTATSTPTPTTPSIPLISQIETKDLLTTFTESTSTPEKEQMQKEEQTSKNKEDWSTIAKYTSTEGTCLPNGNIVWGDINFNDPLAKSFIWFDYPYNPTETIHSRTEFKFNVERIATTTIKISIPGKVRNDSNFETNIKILYWIYMPDQKISTNYSQIISTFTPFTFEISEDYLGHQVAFQMLFSYKCLQSYLGYPLIKPEPSVKFLDL